MKSHGNKSYKNKIYKWRVRHQLGVMRDECSEPLGFLLEFPCFLPKPSSKFWNLQKFHGAKFEDHRPGPNFPAQGEKPSLEVELLAPKNPGGGPLHHCYQEGKDGEVFWSGRVLGWWPRSWTTCSPSPARPLQLFGSQMCKLRVSASATPELTLHPWHPGSQLTFAISLAPLWTF